MGMKVDSKVDIGVLQVWGREVPTAWFLSLSKDMRSLSERRPLKKRQVQKKGRYMAGRGEGVTWERQSTLLHSDECHSPAFPLLSWALCSRLSVYFSAEEHWTGMTKKSSLLAYVNIQLFPREFSPFKGQNNTYILPQVGPNQQWTSYKHMLSTLWTWQHLLLRLNILSRNWETMT